jgi:hypothetical protein
MRQLEPQPTEETGMVKCWLGRHGGARQVERNWRVATSTCTRLDESLDSRAAFAPHRHTANNQVLEMTIVNRHISQ